MKGWNPVEGKMLTAECYFGYVRDACVHEALFCSAASFYKQDVIHLRGYFKL